MSDKKKHTCSYEHGLTDEELDALGWLNNLVAQGSRGCAPRAKQFYLANVAMTKVLKKLNALHDELHDKDRELELNEAVTTGLLKRHGTLVQGSDEVLN